MFTFVRWKVIAALIGLLTLASLAVWGVYAHQQGTIVELSKELGSLKATVATHEQTIENKNKALYDLVALNKDCTEKRAAAAEQTIEAAKQQLKDSGKIQLKTAERVNEIKNEQAVVCDVPVPPRASRLLHEAARAANRAGDSQ